MRKRQPKPTAPPPPADWRAEAERRGEEAFEAATEPAPPPQEPAWLWTPNGKE
jgi:hypothetical protein